MPYSVRYANAGHELPRDWDSPVWNKAETLELTHFRPEGTDHRPRTFVRLFYSNDGISGMFRVEDRYVRCIHTHNMAPVHRDSCVEFFLQPNPGIGYFNFEFNCGGAVSAGYIINPERVPGGFRDYIRLTEENAEQVKIYASMPKVIEPEITKPTLWFLAFFIPFSLLEKYTGPLENVAALDWRANFYKCGDETSHPHWGSWMPLTERNFHLPKCFGTLRFIAPAPEQGPTCQLQSRHQAGR